MTTKITSGLPYDMGNAGDLLKHGVLAEFVRWRHALPPTADKPSFRFFDLFGGKPWEENTHPEVVGRFQLLANTDTDTDIALLAAQPEIAQGRYYGSAHLVWQAAENGGAKNIGIFASDSDVRRDRKLRNSGLWPVTEEISLPYPPHGKTPLYDGYDFFSEIVNSHKSGDLTLVDPFGDFLPRKSAVVVPQMARISERATVVLFALNLDPTNRVGRRFDALLKRHLPNALKMTCPPIPDSAVKGEGKYYADVVLAGPNVSEAGGLQMQLRAFAEKLAAVLGLTGDSAEMLKPKIIEPIA